MKSVQLTEYRMQSLVIYFETSDTFNKHAGRKIRFHENAFGCTCQVDFSQQAFEVEIFADFYRREIKIYLPVSTDGRVEEKTYIDSKGIAVLCQDSTRVKLIRYTKL